MAANPTHLASFVAALADFARALPIWVWVGWALGNPIRVMVERVVVAPDKFKGSLSATDVTARVAAGLAAAGFGGDVVRVPVADGGDGTVAAAVSAGYRRVDIGVRGPVGKAVTASIALLDGTAVIEAAQACGLALLPYGEFAPLTATSRGVGELVLAASRMGAKRIVLGVGGVATTDGGAGLIKALGARLLDADARELPDGGSALSELAEIDLSRLRDLPGIEFWLASDVDNPLLGPHGAASVYGPQKGASGRRRATARGRARPVGAHRRGSRRRLAGWLR